LLIAEKVRDCLRAAIDDFLQIDTELQQQLRLLRGAMAEMISLSESDLAACLEEVEWPGARPTSEWRPGAGLWMEGPLPEEVDASSRRWAEWAEEILAGVHTFAVDGSQIYPSSDWSIPLAAVQVGYFENPHGDGAYVKDVDFKLVAPGDLRDREDETGMRALVNLERHEAEVDTLVRWMRVQAGEKKRLALFDGTLVVSFARGPERLRYVAAIKKLMKTSAETRVPVVAYIDSSRARDLAQMFATATGQGETRVTDGTLLPGGTGWGERTPAFVCARKQGLDNYGDLENEVYFVYLRSVREGRPARLEFPGWILRDGLVNEVVDWVRAEIVAQGGGFPYAIETADAAAVLTRKDHDRMMALFQEFAVEHDLKLDWRAKARSKRMRRA
jgi:hypothetical protein